MASYHRVRYSRDSQLEEQVRGIAAVLGMSHVKPGRVIVLRSTGTRSRRVLARIHGLGRVFQHALGIEAHYIIEILSENFDRLSPEEKTRTLIHELMHIPSSFAGGFRHHATHVNRRSVERVYREYLKATGGHIKQWSA
jgi:predicted metallopeptidase